VPPPAPAYPQQPAQPNHPGYANPNQQQPRPVSADIAKLRAEIARLDLQLKKVQTELQIERQYNQALEAQLHALTHSD
jgi:septal ring factor EnvC (AmiA/AmiB activator)